MRFPLRLFMLLLSAAAQDVAAMPVESFSVAYDLTCSGGKSCSKVIPSENSLGRASTFVLVAGKDGKTRVYSDPEEKNGEAVGKFAVQGKGRSWTKLTLTWDGDLSSSQLSSAGLGCKDLTENGGTALVLRSLKVFGDCTQARGCGLVIESRLYDGNDPTGQRYSTSVIKRQLGSSGKDLFIPFSSFGREGPNGPASATCVGALTLSVQPQALEDASFSVETVSTNGKVQRDSSEQPSVGAVSTAVPTTIAATVTPSVSPTVEIIATPMPSTTPTSTATSTPTQVPTATKIPTLQPTQIATPTPYSTASPTIEVMRQEATRTPTPLSIETISARPTPEEIIYGEVFVGKKSAGGR